MMQRLFFNLVLFVYVATAYTEATTKCYVCGKGADEPFKMSSFNNHNYDDDVNGTASPHQKYNFSSSCDIFDKSLSHENFIYECPSSYVGCITQISGNDVMRTCDILRINDCKTANGVKYCYCASDLCNGKIIEKNLPTMHRQLHKKFIQNSDDEDFMESSGMSESSILHLNGDTDEHNNDDDVELEHPDHESNLNDDFHTENINHIDLSNSLWTTLATSTSNDNHNYRLTTTDSSSMSNLTAAKSQSSSLVLVWFNLNLLLVCVIHLILN